MKSLLCWLWISCGAPVAPAPPPEPHGPALAVPPPSEPVPAQPAVPPASPAPAPPPAAPVSPPATGVVPGPPPARDAAVPSLPAVGNKGGQPARLQLADPPAWRRFAVAVPAAEGRPVLCVVVAELGADAGMAARAIMLPGPLTMAWLPHTPQLAAQLAAAGGHGHEAMLEMPMEGLGRGEAGPDVLRTWLPPAEDAARLRAGLDDVPRAVALLPRDGNVAMLSVPLMDTLARELAARGVAFLDTATLPRSVARERVAAARLPVLAPDLRIDAEAGTPLARVALLEAESVARRAGHAVVLVHARPATLEALEQYLPSTAAHGFVLWPVSALLAQAHPGAPAADRAAAKVGDAVVAPLRNSGAE